MSLSFRAECIQRVGLFYHVRTLYTDSFLDVKDMRSCDLVQAENESELHGWTNEGIDIQINSNMGWYDTYLNIGPHIVFREVSFHP